MLLRVAKIAAEDESEWHFVHVPNFEGYQGRGTGMMVTTVSNSLILGGWVTKVVKNAIKNWGGGGMEGWVTTIF